MMQTAEIATLRNEACERILNLLSSSGWTDAWDDISAIEREAINRMVEVGLAEVRVDYLLTWKSGWLLRRSQTEHLLYQLIGFKWHANGERQAARDAAGLTSAGVVIGKDCTCLMGRDCLEFRLTSIGELTKSRIGSPDGRLDLMQRMTSPAVDFRAIRLGWNSQSRGNQSSATAVALSNVVNNIQVNVPAPVVNVTLPEFTMPQVVVNVSASGTAAPVEKTPPLEVTLKQMEQLSGNEVRVKTMQQSNQETRPKGRRVGTADLFPYRELAEWVKSCWPNANPPSEQEARTELTRLV